VIYYCDRCGAEGSHNDPDDGEVLCSGCFAADRREAMIDKHLCSTCGKAMSYTKGNLMAGTFQGWVCWSCAKPKEA
jgi:formylmethanofuran dehydrogenase subunit E